jgi:succinate-semialdehyde dehydrogenase/glutarate-semialdehyde dehydrogenase
MVAPAPVATYLESHDPATGDIIARFEMTPLASVAGIIARARTAQAVWGGLSIADRCAFLGRLRQVLYDRRHEMAEVVTREVGKPRVESLLADVLVAIDTAAYYSDAGRAEKMLRPERLTHHNLAVKAKSGAMHFEPHGVMGVIAPWNFPIGIPLTQMVTALLAGNTVVLKPSEWAPWCGALVGEVFAQAAFPSDVVQVIQGRGDLGAALVEPPGALWRGQRVDKLLFTGSPATGRKVAEACARNLIPTVLELGGKDAMIVLSDADLEIASSAAVWGAFTNCGQACLSVERLYVEEKIAARFTELCVAKTKKLLVGNGLDPDVEVGPMINEQQLARVELQLADAVAQGARVLVGGKRARAKGTNFFEPTVVTDVNDLMRLMREETFGPVLAIAPVRNAAEAVRRANDSPFGLGASVWTGDDARGRELAGQLRAGAVMINDVISAYGICEAPHGGRGESGWGRTHARLGLLEMVQVKYVAVDRLPRRPKSWWFGYSAEVLAASDRFIEFLLAPGLKQRLGKARGALGAVFRKGRI